MAELLDAAQSSREFGAIAQCADSLLSRFRFAPIGSRILSIRITGLWWLSNGRHLKTEAPLTREQHLLVSAKVSDQSGNHR
jgi:hypothetical protein